MSRSNFDRLGLALMLTTILVWAGSWISMKLVVPYIGPFQVVALRYLSGSLVLFGLLVILHKPLAMTPWQLTLLTGLTQTAGFQILVQIALGSGGVGKVSLLAYTMPFWVIAFAWALLGERPTSRHGAGIALAAAGLVCFLEPWGGMGDLAPVALALGGGLCWGLGTVLSKRMFDRHAPDLMTFTAWQMLMGGLLSIPAALWVPHVPIQWGWQLWAGMLYIVLVATAVGWLLWLAVVRRVPASIAGLSSLGVPVVATLLAWLILDERPTLVEIAGMALILGGLWVVSGARARQAA
ncbi:DMT family transporter [Bordetella petrii]|uniref:DMT family transporter n=1 Tax=Bordetella petrii TaxID=94624 RepID=UPI001E5F55A8|nr:DMT family transporter [Bordetella petrii]MCD0503970.1 DMT family transporter [Bordetella petrii]